MGLLEREAELAAIGAAIERARAGQGAVLVVEGAAGIGKSSLLAAGCASARDMRVIRASAVPLEQTYAFGVARALFEPLRGGGLWAELTADAARLALPALDPAAALAGPGEEARHAALHGLTWLTANLAAETPLLIVVDDVHWADAPSLRWLAHLARRIGALPALALLAVRTGEPPSAPALLHEVLASAQVVRPTPLGPASTAALVRARLRDAEPDLCAACHAATGGNPFLADALAGALADGSAAATRVRDGATLPSAQFGPEAVTRDVARRLDRLGRGTREAALAIAILGAGAAPRLVAALAGLSREEAATAADALRVAELLAPGVRLEFAHPILAAAVAAQLGPSQTAVWHGRAWRLLHADGADAERQALHLLHTEPEGDPAAVATLRAAAEAALKRGAAETAATYLRRALDEPPTGPIRASVLLECGLALAAHRDREAPGRLREAILLIDDPGRRAEAALQAAQALALAALYDDMIAIGELALADTGDASAEVVARLEAELVGLGLTRAEAIPGCRARVARARREPPPVGLWRVNAAGLDTFTGVPASQVLAELRRPELDRERGSLVGTVVRALMLIYNDDLERALSHCETLFDDARPRGWASAVANAGWLRAMAALRMGRVTDAIEDARAAYAFKREVGAPPDSLAWAAGPFADALREHGELDAADAVLERLDVDALARGVLTRPILLESRAWLRLAQQRPEAALRDAHAAAAEWAVREADGPGVVGWRPCSVEALVALDRRPEANALARTQLELAERHGTVSSLVAALRALAVAAPPEAAVPLLERACRVAAGEDGRHGAPDALDHGVPTRLEHLRALVDLGAARRRCGRLEAARAPLRVALHHADRSGAARLAERARAELVAAGARPRRAALSGRDALTAAEQRVASLAAEGRTNRQIAQALFVTQRTVETHLTHTFAKLDVTSRDELAAALWPATPVPA